MDKLTFKIKETPNYQYQDDVFIVYGNYTNFNPLKLKEILSDKTKICIFYDLNLFNNTNSNHEILRNNIVVYYYKDDIPSVNSFKSSTRDIVLLIDEISNFLNEKIEHIRNLNTTNLIPSAAYAESSSNSDTPIFKEVYNGSFRETGKPYGYIDCNYSVKKYRANNVSSLYLLESQIAFTPGKIASTLNGSGYESKWQNSGGYVKVHALRAQYEVGYNQTRYGGTPVFKDAYPVNSPGQISIASTYNVGINLGYSFKNGFSLDNISIESNQSIGLNISYGYSKTYTNVEPALSAQKDPNDLQTYTWVYSYASARNETNNMNIGYMFEMNNYGHDLFEGELAFKYEYEMTVSNANWWIFETKKSFEGYSYHNYY